jgi:hypothetical protein
MGLLLSWRDGVDAVLSGRQELSDAERARFEGWLAEEVLGDALTG